MDCDGNDVDRLNFEVFRIVTSDYEAIKKASLVAKLLRIKPDLNLDFQENENGNTALHLSVESGDREMIKFLLDLGVDVSIKNKEGKTARELAISLGRSNSLMDLFGGNEIDECIENDEKTLYMDLQKSLVLEEIKEKIINSKARVVKLINCATKSCALAFISNKLFCEGINGSPYVFILVIQVGEKFSDCDETNFEEFNSKITESRPFIVQIGSGVNNSRQLIFYREPCKSLIIYKQETEKTVNVEYLTAATNINLGIFLTMLENGFGGFFSHDLLTITLDTTQNFDDWRFIDYAAWHNDSLSLRLLMFAGDWNLHERNGHGSRVLELAAQHGDVSTVSSILDLPLNTTTSSYAISEEHNGLFQLKDFLGMTPLFLALEAGNNRILQLFNQWGLGREEDYESMVNVFWREKNYDMLASLIKEDAPFPSDFFLDFNHEGLQEIVDGRKIFHDAIKQNDKETVLTFIASSSNIKRGYSVENKVALETALEYKIFNIFALLLSKGFYKTDKITSLLDGLTQDQKRIIQEEREKLIDDIESGHIFSLSSRSKEVSETDTNKFKSRIEQLYSNLDLIPQVSQVLKLLKYAENLEIIFDFNETSIINIDPTSKAQTKGSCNFECGKIYIGAKRVNDSELLGTLAHEFTHLSIQIMYNNESRPYDCFDSSRDKSFADVINSFEKRKFCDDIVKKVFECYNRHDWPSELIVRGNQMRAQYGNDASEKLHEAQLLIDWYDKHVKPDIEKFINNPSFYKYENKIQKFNIEHDFISLTDPPIEFIEKVLFPQEIFKPESPSIIVSEYSKLDLLNLYQMLSKNMTRSEISRNVIFLSSIHLKNEAKCANMCTLRDSNVRPKLIIDCTGLESVDHVVTILNRLRFKGNSILIAKIEQEQKLSEALCLKDECVSKSLLYNFEYLSETTKKYLFQRNVIFQNIKVKLCDIHSIDSPFNKHLLVAHLLEDEKLIIGEPDTHWTSEIIFMERTFIGDIVLDHSYFSHDRWGKIVFSEEDYRKECQQNQVGGIHLFAKSDNYAYLVKSHGDLSELRRYLLPAHEFQGHEFVKNAAMRKTTILSDLPGNGKSTVMNHFSKVIKENNNNYWVSVIRLNEYTDIFERFREKLESLYYSPDCDFEGTIEFLSEKILKLRSPFEKELFRYGCLNEDSLIKVALFFDGLDEVSPAYYRSVVGLIDILKKTEIKHIWVATRLHLAENIDFDLETVHYKLKPLSTNQQITFLTKFWLGKQFTDNKYNIQTFAEALVSNFSDQLINNYSIGMPLLLTLLANIHSVDAENFCKGNYSKLHDFADKLDIYQLFQSYLRMKREIYMQDKTRQTLPPTLTAQERDDRDWANLLEIHKKIAISILFNGYEYFREKANDAMKDVSNEELFRIGLLTMEYENINFIHRAVAEYFAAQFIFEQSKDEFSDGHVQSILVDVLVSVEYYLVRAFMDRSMNFSFSTEITRELRANKCIKKVINKFALENNWNLINSLIIGLKSLDSKIQVENFINNKVILRTARRYQFTKALNKYLEGEFCMEIKPTFFKVCLSACCTGNIGLLKQIHNLKIPPIDESYYFWKGLLHLGWHRALSNGKESFLDEMFSWITENDVGVRTTLLTDESTWFSCIEGSYKCGGKLRNWIDCLKLNENDVKLILTNTSIWEKAVDSFNEQLDGLWEWCKDVNLEIKELQALLGHDQLWKIAAKNRNFTILNKLLIWSQNISLDFRVLKEFLVSGIAWSFFNAQFHTQIFDLISTFDLSLDNFKTLFRSITNSPAKNWDDGGMLVNFMSLARERKIDQRALKDEILLTWRYACITDESILVDYLWKWMDEADFTIDEKKYYLFDSMSWELVLLAHSPVVQLNFWSKCFDTGINGVECTIIFKRMWCLLAACYDAEQIKNFICLFSQNKPEFSFELPIMHLQFLFSSFFSKKYPMIENVRLEDFLTSRGTTLKLSIGVRSKCYNRGDYLYSIHFLTQFPNGLWSTTYLPEAEVIINENLLYELLTDPETWEVVGYYGRTEILKVLHGWLIAYSIDDDTKRRLVLKALKGSIQQFDGNNYCYLLQICKDLSVDKKIILKMSIEALKESITTGECGFFKFLSKILIDRKHFVKIMLNLKVWRIAAKNGHHRLIKMFWKFIKNKKLFKHVLKDVTVWSLASENGHVQVLQLLWIWCKKINIKNAVLNKLLLNSWEKAIMCEKIKNKNADLIKLLLIPWRRPIARTLCKTNVIRFLIEKIESEDMLNKIFEIILK